MNKKVVALVCGILVGMAVEASSSSWFAGPAVGVAVWLFILCLPSGARS